MKEPMCFLFILLICGLTRAAPSSNSFVVTSTEATKENKNEDSTNSSPGHPIIYQMHITSNISNRFAKTLVSSQVKNGQTSAKETTFTVVLPEKAFISGFVMEIGGKSYKAYVKEKEEARRDYSRALASGQSAGHVAVSARNSNRFTVSINVEPESKATFLLTYEELLERKEEKYELVINIHPGQIVKKLDVAVHINESRPLKFVKTPSLRSGNEISKNEEKLDPSSDIQIINSTAAIVKFSPDSERQRQFAKDLGGKESDGLSGQFVVQYDVERNPHGGEVLLDDGYFIHFFAPSDLEPLPKHVVFVLDTSGSMAGTKISQLKDAMKSILNEIKLGDMVNIIEFNNIAKVWDIKYQNTTETRGLGYSGYQAPFPTLSELSLPIPTLATNESISKAKNIIDKLDALGGTNIIEGLETALYLIKVGQEHSARYTDKKYQPIMIFLTDGDPNVGMYSRDEITRTVTKLNSQGNNVPIFSLSFGSGANKKFLKSLSLKNQGFSRHIYEASDASLQLQEFYKQISSPLLSDVNFKYESEVDEVTKTHFPIYFRGSEIVVAGRYRELGTRFPTAVNCLGPSGLFTLHPVTEKPVTSLERLWAYLTVKQTLEKRDAVENKDELNKKALDLALKYSFVTDVTSLVVVKPNVTNTVDTEDASGGRFYPTYHPAPALTSTYPQHGVAPRYFASAAVQRRYNGYEYQYYRASPRDFARFGGGSPRHHDHIKSTTAASTTTTTTTTQPPPKSSLQNSLPWLSSALNSNGCLTIGQDTYELGESATSPITNIIQCPKTPQNNTEAGECKLLKDCPEVYASLTNFQVYQQYFCPLQLDNRYAGVCCPKKLIST